MRKNAKKNRTKGKTINQLSVLTIFAALAAVALMVSLFYGVLEQRKELAEATPKLEKIELELTYAYQNPMWNSAIESIVAEFEKSHENIQIKYEISYEDEVYEEALSRKIAMDTLGDIVQLKTPDLYAKNGLLAQIDSEVTQLVSENYTYDDTVYGVGIVESTWGILYNKKFFRNCGISEPETYEEFVGLCKRLVKNNICPIGIAGMDLWHMEFWTDHFFRAEILAENPDWLKKCRAGEVSWKDEEVTQILRRMKQFADKDYLNRDWMAVSDTELSQLFASERLAMIYTGPWTVNTIKEINPDLELGWFVLPTEDGDTYAQDNLDTFWGINADCEPGSEKYDAAMEFLRFFYESDSYSKLCQSTCTYPLTKNTTEYEMSELQTEIKSDFDAADQKVSGYIGDGDCPTGFEKKVLLHIVSLLSGSEDIEECQNGIQQDWEDCWKEETEK